MKKHLLLILSSLAVMFFAFGCDNSNGPEEEPTPTKIVLELDKTDLEFDQTGGNKDFTIDSNSDWAIAENAPWIEVSQTTGYENAMITVSVQSNDTPDNRNSVLTIIAGDIEKTLTVTQQQQDALTVTSTKFAVPASGETISIEVRANIDYEYEIGQNSTDWITPVATRALETSNLNFIVKPNETVNKREGTITVKSGALSQIINVSQAGLTPTLTIKQKQYDVAADGETITIEIDANIDYSIQMPNVEWITDVSGTQSDKIHSYTIRKNNTLNSRDAKITFYNNSQGIREEVIILQRANTAENLYTATLHVPTGGTLNAILIEKGLQQRVDNLTITGTLNNLDFDTLRGLNNLRHLDISGVNITTLPNQSFKGFQYIESVILPQTLIEIGINAFYRVESLKAITIGSNVLNISYGAFYRCRGLEAIEFQRPSKIKTIGEQAFAGCSSLTTIEIPNSVETIGEKAFYGASLSSGISFGMGSQLKEIRHGAFDSCQFTSIHIPAGVKVIESFAFYSCTSLEVVSFEQGSQLQELLPAFENCKKLRTFDASACTQLSHMRMGFFDNAYNFSLRLFKLGAEIPPLVEQIHPFSSFYRNLEVKVPDNSVDAYKESDWGMAFENISGLNE